MTRKLLITGIVLAIAVGAGHCAGFAGKWQTNWGTMELSVAGNKVTGRYTHDSGKIVGTVSSDGRTLEGTWSESPTYKPPRDSGRVVLKLAADGNSFTGTYWYGQSGAGGSWSGTRIPQVVTKPVPLSRWAGKWQTNWGIMTLSVSGSKVTGTYEHDSGKVEGTISADGRTIEGKWSESPSYSPPRDSGKLILKLADDGNSFSGQWWYGESGSPGNWTGTKIQ